MKPWKEVIDGIRNAVLGKEVREDLAQMGEYIEKFANTAGENIQKAIDPTLSISGKAADAAKVGEAVGEITEDLTEKIPLGINIKNYLDSGNMTTGGYIDTDTGNIIDYESWCYSDYIATKPGATLCTIGWDSNLWKIRNTTYVAFYNANKTFISGYIAEAGKT